MAWLELGTENREPGTGNWTPDQGVLTEGRGIAVGLPAVLGTAGVVTGHVKSQEIETTTKEIALFFLFVCFLSFKQIPCLPPSSSND